MSFQSKKLSQLNKGDSAVIESFTDDVMKLKLLEMGCLPGEEIRVERFAPLGDPMAIQLCNTIWASWMECRLFGVAFFWSIIFKATKHLRC